MTRKINVNLVLNKNVLHLNQTGNKKHPTQKPLWGKLAKKTGSVNSLDGKWRVEFYEVTYYFLRIEMFTITKEKVVPYNPNLKD